MDCEGRVNTLRYPCQRCGAKPGEVCRTASGRDVRPARESHAPRWEIAYAVSSIARHCEALEGVGADTSALRDALGALGWHWGRG